MDFDQMLETWRAQNTASPHDVNRDALRQALQTEEARVREELRSRRRGLWFLWIFYAGMAVWAGLRIAITMTNGWPAIYVIAAAVSLGLFALGVGAVWVSRGAGGARAEFRQHAAGGGEAQSGARRRSTFDYQALHHRCPGRGVPRGWHAAVLLDRKQEPGHPRFIGQPLVHSPARSLDRVGFLQRA